MDELPAGVTRYPSPGRRPVKVDRLGLGGLAVLLVGGNAFALVVGARPVYLVVLAVVCALAPPASIVLPPAWLRFAAVAVAQIAVLGWLGSQDEYAAGYAFSWFASTVTGLGLLSGLVFRRWWHRRLASAEGAPPSGLDPRGQRDVGVLAWWLEAGFEFEMVDPTSEVVLGVMRSLDGRTRSVVSVYRGAGRLDVAGSAAGSMVVQQSDERRKWHQVTSPAGASHGASKQTVTVAGYPTVFPRERTTELGPAERAMTTWLARGERDEALSWWNDTALDRAQRPKILTDTD